jgi:hypothetical protein
LKASSARIGNVLRVGCDFVLFCSLQNLLCTFQLQTNVVMNLKVRSWILLLLASLALAGCDWNRTAKAQRQEYRALRAEGPAYTPSTNELTRRKGYFQQSEGDMVNQMRQR